MATTIKLSHKTVGILAKRKKSPKESYDDVIKRLLSETEPLPLSKMLTKAYHYLRGRGVKNIQVFGSILRGERASRSDLDLLIDLPDSVNLFDLAGMELELSELLGIEVDLVPRSALNPFMRDGILREARDILEVARR
jgi:hypothetical protein